MKRAVRGQPELEAKLHALLRPGPIPGEIKRANKFNRDLKRRRAQWREEAERARREWKERVASSANRLRLVNECTVNECFPILFRMAREIGERSEHYARFGTKDWEVLRSEFGTELSEAVRDGLMRFWRLYRPPLRSEQAATRALTSQTGCESDGGHITHGIIVGLTGLAIEARECPDWVRRLPEGEACLAARYAIHEINGLPGWATELVKAHPAVFDSVMLPELTWEFTLPGDKPEPHHLIATLPYGPQPIRERYRTIVERLLEKHEPAHAQTLESALSVLLQWDGFDRSTFAALARQRYNASQDERRRFTWLVAWMCVDGNGALEALRAWLDDADDRAQADRRMIAFCNALMSDREIRFGSNWRDFERLEVLRELVPLVFQHVRIEEDNLHDGAYSPDERDDAENTRGYLLSRVAQSPGRAAFDMLMAFSKELPNKKIRDRILVLASRRAAEDAEPKAWKASDVVSFATEAETDPQSDRDLFELVCTRLDDLKLDLEEGDASEARILRGVNEETDLRTWFANRLRQSARRRYNVPPEEELADATRPDLRIHAPGIDAPVAIELKIADKWSYPQLCDRLRHQLVEQYLRDARSRFGIFLLVWRGRERWRDPDTREILSFNALLERLKAEATIILRSRYDLDAISVVGIDLTRRDMRY